MVDNEIAKNLLAGQTCGLCHFNARMFIAGDSLSQSETIEHCVLSNNKKNNTCSRWKSAQAESVHYGTFLPTYTTKKFTLLDKMRKLWKKMKQLKTS